MTKQIWIYPISRRVDIPDRLHMKLCVYKVFLAAGDNHPAGEKSNQARGLYTVATTGTGGARYRGRAEEGEEKPRYGLTDQAISSMMVE